MDKKDNNLDTKDGEELSNIAHVFIKQFGKDNGLDEDLSLERPSHEPLDFTEPET